MKMLKNFLKLFEKDSPAIEDVKVAVRQHKNTPLEDGIFIGEIDIAKGEQEIVMADTSDMKISWIINPSNTRVVKASVELFFKDLFDFLDGRQEMPLTTNKEELLRTAESLVYQVAFICLSTFFAEGSKISIKKTKNPDIAVAEPINKEINPDYLIISVFRKKVNKKGYFEDICLFSTLADRKIFEELVVSNLNPGEIFSNFPTKLNIIGSVLPYEPTADNEVSQKQRKQVLGYSPVEFEKLIRRLLEKMGYEITETKITGDGGIDLEAVSDDKLTGGLYIIQCKRYGLQNPVGVTTVRELSGVVFGKHATKGILITTSHYTKQAIEEAGGKVNLVDGKILIELLEKYMPNEFEI